MKTRYNSFEMNPLDIKKFTILIVSFHFVVWGLIGLDSLEFRIPLLRQFFCFFYLSFVPGMVILRLFKLGKLSDIEYLLYSVGLSISFLMFTGFIINTFFPLIGISRPINLISLILTITVPIFILCLLCHYINKKSNLDFDNLDFFLHFKLTNVKEFFSFPRLILYLIPLLSVFGTHLVNFYQNNILIILVLLLISSVVFFIAFDYIFQTKHYSLIIWVISVSLLLHVSLISNYLVELGDISFEYWYSKLALFNSHWNSQIPSNINAMLSIVILAPIYSIFCDINLVWVYKIVYVLLFSLVPVGLYDIFQKQTDNKTAFFSVFFFMAMFSFYRSMPGLARQQIAELFFVSFLLLYFNTNIPDIKKGLLRIIFLFSLSVSHYGFLYLFLMIIVTSYVVSPLFYNYNSPSLTLMEESSLKHKLKFFFKLFSNKNRFISLNSILVLFVFSFSWYSYLANSTAFDSFVKLGDNIVSNLITDFFSMQSSQGLEIILKETKSGFIGNIYKIIHLISQFFITIGLIDTILKSRKYKFHVNYIIISIPFFALCIAAIVVPRFGLGINTSRLYGISLLVLSPYFMVGGSIFLNLWNKIKSVKLIRLEHMKILATFLFIYFLFNCGLIFEFTGHESSFSINQTSSNRTPNFNSYEINGAVWLSHNIPPNIIVFSDAKNSYLIQMEVGYFFPFQKDRIESNQIKKSYVFLGTENLLDDTLWVDNPQKSRLDLMPINYSTSNIYNEISLTNNIYENNGVDIYYHF